MDNNGYINENGSTYIKNKADNDYHIVLKKTNNKYYNKKKFVNNSGVKTQEQQLISNPNTEDLTGYPEGQKQLVSVVKNDQPFLTKVKEAAQDLQSDYTELLAIMETESSLNPHENAGKCSGLIQFKKVINGITMKYANINDYKQYESTMSLAKIKTKYGKTAVELSQMERPEQMEYVWGFFYFWKKTNNMTGRLTTSQLYTIPFTPAYATKPDDFIIASSTYNSDIWTANPGLQDKRRSDKAIWKGHLGKLIKAKAIKYEGL